MNDNRHLIIRGAFVLIAAVFVIKLFTLQVLDGDYKQAAEKNSLKKLVEYPYRGLIYDRKGRLLVYNVPVYDIMVTPREVVMRDTLAFCRLMRLPREVFEQKMQDAVAYSSRKPSAFVKQMSEIDFARVQDQLVDYPGFSVVPRTVRGYPHQSMANVLGYIGEISQTKLDAVDKTEYAYGAGDYIGISGLEAQYEYLLRGQKGVRHELVNVHGIRKGRFKDGAFDTSAVKGADIRISLDLELQQFGERLMTGKLGSVVAIEPSTGEILAMISSPTYDPNLLRGREFPANFRELQQDPLVPLFNRPLMADRYPPGSTFKLLQALIAMQEGLVGPETRIACAARVKCHPHPSPANLHQSIQYSCNPYYFHVFRRIINQDVSTSTFEDSHIGLNKWRDYMVSFGLGNRLGIDIPNEKRGLIPNAGFYDRIYGEKRWKFSTIYSLGIGQGEIGLTPLQMANMTALIANRGHYYTPHLLRQIGQTDTLPENLREKHVSMVESRHFGPVIGGMEDAVRAGTVWGMARPPANLQVCGKTGTSQNPQGKDHSVFVAFAPRDNPKIAIAAFVENAGFGGTVAAPVANLMIEKYLSDTLTTQGKWLEKYMIEKSFLPENVKLTAN